MNAFLQTFLGGLALAAVSGVVWLAWHYPDGYKRALPNVRGVIVALWCTLVVLVTGVALRDFEAVIETVDDEAVRVVAKGALGYFRVIFWGGLVAIGIGWAAGLPIKLHEIKKADEEGDED